jgi:hypothetical protein
MTIKQAHPEVDRAWCLLSAEALGLDEFETLPREKAYLAAARAGGGPLRGRGWRGPQGQEQTCGAEEAGGVHAFV